MSLVWFRSGSVQIINPELVIFVEYGSFELVCQSLKLSIILLFYGAGRVILLRSWSFLSYVFKPNVWLTGLRGGEVEGARFQLAGSPQYGEATCWRKAFHLRGFDSISSLTPAGSGAMLFQAFEPPANP